LNVLYLADIRFPMERANGIQTIETCHALARDGIGVELVVRRSDSRSDAACLEFFGLAPHPNLRLRRLAIPAPGTSWGHLVFAAKCLPLMKDGRHDAVYTRDLVLADLALRTKWLHGLPTLYEAHTVASVFSEETARLYDVSRPAPPTPAKLRRLARREHRVCHEATAVVTITRGLLDCLVEQHGPLTEAHVVPDGARVVEPPPPARKRPPGKAFRIYYIGQLYPWKGVDLLVESMPLLPGAELVIVGGLPPEPDLDRVRGLAQRLGLTERVHFRGFLPPPAVAEERKNADAFVIPLLDSTTARRFTSPLKLFEAMASGRPIVASDLPSIGEVLRHDENALLVPPGDVKSLASALQRLADEPETGARLAARASEEVHRYSWDERGRKLGALLRSVVTT
jgi:glycosyltransferase involved in cell wall biosynthesis